MQYKMCALPELHHLNNQAEEIFWANKKKKKESRAFDLMAELSFHCLEFLSTCSNWSSGKKARVQVYEKVAISVDEFHSFYAKWKAK